MHPYVHSSIIHSSQDMKQPKCTSADGYIWKIWYLYTMEYYSAIKKNKIMQSAAIWMQLEIIILSEVSQKEKNTI